MSVTSNNPLWLAPMADITAWPVRKMCFHLGVGLAHTEMISAKAVVDKNQSVFPSLFRHPNEGPLVLQLFSGNVDFLLEAAEEALKVSSFEALGINMECPSKKVMASGGGAAMIFCPDVATQMIKETKALGLPICVKTRIPSHNLHDAVKWCELLVSSGADNVAVHARTPSQGYNGISDKNIMKEIAKAFPGMITATGDVFTSGDVVEYLEMGCKSVLVARGALKNPFMIPDALKALGYFADFKDSFKSRVNVFRTFLIDLCEIEDNSGMHLLRHFLSCIFKGMPRASYMRSSLANAGSIAKTKELFDSYINDFNNLYAKGEQ